MIEEITKKTASTASHIYAASWKEAYKGIVPQDYLDTLDQERWSRFFGVEHDTFRKDYLLIEAGKAVATSSICTARDEDFDGWGEIMSIYVLPEEFRKGYGRKLFIHDLKQLNAAGFEKIYLWVFEENPKARAFYEAMGFHWNGDRNSFEIAGKELVEVRYVNTPMER